MHFKSAKFPDEYIQIFIEVAKSDQRFDLCHFHVKFPNKIPIGIKLLKEKILTIKKSTDGTLIKIILFCCTVEIIYSKNNYLFTFFITNLRNEQHDLISKEKKRLKLL